VVEVAAPDAFGSVVLDGVAVLCPLVLWSVDAGCEYEGVALVLPLVDPVAAPLWSELVAGVLLGVELVLLGVELVLLGVACVSVELLGVVDVLGVVTDWFPLGEAELIPEFAGFAELFGFVEVSG